VDLLFVPASHVVDVKLPAVSGSSGRLVVERMDKAKLERQIPRPARPGRNWPAHQPGDFGRDLGGLKPNKGGWRIVKDMMQPIDKNEDECIMKAIICRQYGTPDVLKLEEIPQPIPKDKQVLVKIHAASVNAADWHLLTADIFLVRLMMGLFKPKISILGGDIAGTVEAVGAGVTRFKPGNAVFGDVLLSGGGGFAEYVVAPEGVLALKPANLTFEQAAAAPIAALTALAGLRDLGKIKAGKKMLINGASGGVGTFAVQIAKAFGAEVTAVCSSRNVEMARQLGADHVIDYTQQNFTQTGQQYDLILAANGYHPIWAYRRALTPTGIYVMAGGRFSQMIEAMLLGPLLSRKGGRQLLALSAETKQKDLQTIREMLEAGRIVPVIDRCYPLAEVPEAMRYLGDGHARGKVVITVARK
jgi:NADPH:quinone reductase-like Zn-dependent oxidoreductase